VATAREALHVAEAGYRGGTANGTDVRDAETALADARADEAQSAMDYWTARASLDHAMGATAPKEH
jgi:outer membrane protein TolC